MIEKTITRLSNLLIVMAGLALILMMVHVSLDVMAKYLINFPVPGTTEIVAAYYMISIVFLPLAYIELNNKSIVVEMLYGWLPNMAKGYVDILSTLMLIGFYGFLAYLGFGLAEEAWEVREYVDGLWRVVIWPSRFLIPLGLAVACIALVLRLVLLVGYVAGFAKPVMLEKE